jgi:hypothetical protein
MKCYLERIFCSWSFVIGSMGSMKVSENKMGFSSYFLFGRRLLKSMTPF